jgi:excisionase family DNA binding protein
METEWLEPWHAAVLLDVSVATVYRWLKVGALEGERRGRGWRISRAEVDRNREERPSAYRVRATGLASVGNRLRLCHLKWGTGLPLCHLSAGAVAGGIGCALRAGQPGGGLHARLERSAPPQSGLQPWGSPWADFWDLLVTVLKMAPPS